MASFVYRPPPWPAQRRPLILPAAAQAATASFIASGAATNVPSLAYAATGAGIGSGSSAQAPTLSYTATAPTIASTAIARAPVLSYAATPPAIASGSATTPPSVTPPAQSVTFPTIGPAGTIFVPVLSAAVTLATIASGAIVSAPSTAYLVTIGSIASTAVANAPILTTGLDSAIVLGTIGSTVQIGAPVVTPPAAVLAAPAIASSSTLYGMALAFAVQAPAIPTGASVRPPVLGAAMQLQAIASASTTGVPTLAYAMTAGTLATSAIVRAPVIQTSFPNIAEGTFIFSTAQLRTPNVNAFVQALYMPTLLRTPDVLVTDLFDAPLTSTWVQDPPGVGSMFTVSGGMLHLGRTNPAGQERGLIYRGDHMPWPRDPGITRVEVEIDSIDADPFDNETFIGPAFFISGAQAFGVLVEHVAGFYITTPAVLNTEGWQTFAAIASEPEADFVPGTRIAIEIDERVGLARFHYNGIPVGVAMDVSGYISGQPGIVYNRRDITPPPFDPTNVSQGHIRRFYAERRQLLSTVYPPNPTPRQPGSSRVIRVYPSEPRQISIIPDETRIINV